MLSIIIVNYRTPQLTIDCIHSIMTHTSGIEFEIVVVDNQSGDNSDVIIKQAYPDVTLHQMGYNAGFARANNLGIDKSVGDAVLLLNSDTIVHDNAIGNCYYEFMRSTYGACGLQLLNRDGSPQISGNYFMKGGLNLLLALPYTGAWVKKAGELVKVKKPNVPDSNSIVEVDWINGAFLMVKRTVIAEVGKMDEDFFLYAEETEWCYRIRQRYRLCIYGQFKLTHLQGVSATDAFGSGGEGYSNIYDRKGFQYLLSNFLRLYKQYGIGWYLAQLMIFTITVPITWIGDLFSKPVYKNRASGLTKNVFLLWRYTPRIFSGKKYFYKVL